MRKQAIRYTAAGAAGLLVVVALVVMVNWLAARHWSRGDWTSSRLYSLSETTVNLLGDLDEDIRVVVFMTPASTLYDQVRELLNRYATASDRIRVEYIDPDKEPLTTRQLAEQFGVSVANTVVFAAGERSKYVTSDEMADYDYSGMQFGQEPSMRAFKGEEQFSAAILSLVAPRVPRASFVTGHGEASLAGDAVDPQRGLGALREALQRATIEADDVTLLGGAVPETSDVLAIVGPTATFTDVEIAALERYLEGGGRLLICLDPLIERDGRMRPTGLEGLLADRGVEVHDDLVVDPSRRLPFFDLSAVYLQDFGAHAVTTGLEGMAVLFPVARSLGILDDEARRATSLVRTSADGWGETDLRQLLQGEPVAIDGADTAGPVDVAVAVEQDGGGLAAAAGDAEIGARIVVFGDSDFLTDGQIVNAGNLTLALNAFKWLAAREEALGIPPRQVDQVSLYLSGQQLTTILLLVLVGLPGAAIVLGVVVWRRRRH